MFLKSLYLHNFRNYEKAYASFTPSINLIQGDNAQGKTNLLEALYFLSSGKSFRTTHLKDLIRHNSPGFYLEVVFFKEGMEQSLKLSFDGQIRKMQYNYTLYPHFNNLLGLLPTVLYTPEDISLVAGSPADRRRFLDLHIAQIDPLYVHHLTRYYHAMKQRNTLLRKKSAVAITPWEHAMAQAASYIIPKRIETLESLNPLFSHVMQELSAGKDRLEIHYQSPLQGSSKKEDLLSFLKEEWARLRPKEMLFGSTLLGPHRDELLILLNQKPARGFSSEGQKWCSLAALRLAEWQRLKSLLSFPPLLSIDDFGIHLDTNRQKLLEEHLSNLGSQVFLTSPHPMQSEAFFPHKTALIVEQGQFLPPSSLH